MRSELSSRAWLGILLVGLVGAFGAGTYVGYQNRPEVLRVAGVVGVALTPPAGSSTKSEITLCMDEKGVQVPCITPRSSTSSASLDTPADFSDFWKAWNIINERFVPTKKEYTTNQERVWGAIQGLAGSLGDPYTFFLPPQEKSLFEQDVRGAFGGVGMQIGIRDGVVTVISPLKGSPAERAGIRAGDRVFAVDGATTTEMTIDKVLYLIRGEIGTSVRLTLLRDKDKDPKPFDVIVTREEIVVPTIETKKEDGVFIISLYGFPATGNELFRNALREFSESGTDKLIIDLRGNPGGYLEVAVDMASWFLPEGKLVVREEERSGTGRSYRSKGYNAFGDDFKIVILVNEGSASAAEILAGALQEHGVAVLVGATTFGKGSVQELVEIGKDSALKVTVARWITPNGTNLSAGGIVPDIVVPFTKEDLDAGKDPQLEKAKEAVIKQGGKKGR